MPPRQRPIDVTGSGVCGQRVARPLPIEELRLVVLDKRHFDVGLHLGDSRHCRRRRQPVCQARGQSIWSDPHHRQRTAQDRQRLSGAYGQFCVQVHAGSEASGSAPSEPHVPTAASVCSWTMSLSSKRSQSTQHVVARCVIHTAHGPVGCRRDVAASGRLGRPPT